jgi:hypothetical protein
VVQEDHPRQRRDDPHWIDAPAPIGEESARRSIGGHGRHDETRDDEKQVHARGTEPGRTEIVTLRIEVVTTTAAAAMPRST